MSHVHRLDWWEWCHPDLHTVETQRWQCNNTLRPHEGRAPVRDVLVQTAARGNDDTCSVHNTRDWTSRLWRFQQREILGHHSWRSQSRIWCQRIKACISVPCFRNHSRTFHSKHGSKTSVLKRPHILYYISKRYWFNNFTVPICFDCLNTRNEMVDIFCKHPNIYIFDMYLLFWLKCMDHYNWKNTITDEKEACMDLCQCDINRASTTVILYIT